MVTTRKQLNFCIIEYNTWHLFSFIHPLTVVEYVEIFVRKNDENKIKQYQIEMGTNEATQR